MLPFRRRCPERWATVFILFLTALALPARAVVYVNSAAPGATHDGKSWATAFLTVQEGINLAALTGDEVWVVAGTYQENLIVSAPVKLYGGFAGTESSLSGRNYRTRVTVLDGKQTERVIYLTGSAGAAVIDGFTITNGRAGDHGGGIRIQDCTATVRNNVITGNSAGSVGGAIYVLHGSPKIVGNVITGNTANECGGIFVDNSNGARVVSNVVARNRSNNGNRGGIFVSWAPIDIIGNTVTDNYGNGAITHYNSASRIINNIVAWNTGGIRLETGAAATLSNNCLWQNRGYDTTGYDPTPIGQDGNINADPMLSWDARGAAHLRLGSPCLNTGLDTAVAADDTDIDGEARKFGAVDIGADESTGTAPVQAVVYVKPTGDDANSGASWAQPKKTITAALAAAFASGAEVWVAAGTYKESVDLRTGIALYGGFNGTETVRTQRNWRTNVTTIDAESKSNVVRADGTITLSTILDGFVLVNGATGEHGAGIRTQDAAPLIRNNIIRACTASQVGGGIYTLHGSPWIVGNVITGNTANECGGVFVDNSNGARVVSNVVARNRSNNGNRGGIFVSWAPIDIIGNTVTDNYGNGAITHYNSASRIINNIVAWNTGGIRLETGAAATLSNNCLWQNRGYDTTGYDPTPIGQNGNINADPMLSWDAVGTAHLRLGSPCLNAGLSTAFVAQDTDVDGQARINGAAADIGADESTGTAPVQAVVYVKPTGDDANSGASWAQPKKTITAALAAAFASGAEVWVAAGTYKESVDLRTGIALYGGFNGTETVRTQRNWRTNVTTIDAESKSNVVRADGTITLSTILDGFVLVNGATGEHGAGIRTQDAAPLIRNNIIRACTASQVGGGIYILRGSPWIVGNVITANTANECGGIFVDNSGGARIVSNVVARNRSNNFNRSGIHVQWAPADIIGNTVVGNYGNGAIASYSSSSRIIGNIVAFNTHGLRLENGTCEVRNNNLYGNTVYDTTNFPTAVVGANGNISADPMITPDAIGSYHLRPGSPCLNAGLSTAFVAQDTDVDGQARINGAAADIGADESDGSTPVGGIVYVKPSGDDTKTGASWALAKKTIQAGIDAASLTNSEVWVAAGTYMQNIRLAPAVAVYGGFAGTETQRSQRNWRANATIIDGNKNGPVVYADTNVTRAATLDGFTITNGYASDHGGGVRTDGYAAPVIANNRIVYNNAPSWGGGVFLAQNGGAWLINNVVANNTSGDRGGGIAINGAYYARAEGNVVARNRGATGGIDCESSSAYVINNTITNNTGDGALMLWNAGARAWNNIVAFNSSGVRTNNRTQDLLFRNNLVYGNAGYNYSGMADPEGAGGNLSAMPLLATDAWGVEHLRPGSPGIGAGLNSIVTPGVADIDGQTRIQNGTVDIGADEFDGSTPAQTVLYVRPGGDDAANGSSWTLAKRTLQGAIDAAARTGAEVWAAVGPYRESITLAAGVAVYGGFRGNETLRSQRDYRANVTVIDGGGARAVYAPYGSTSGSVLDGFTITNGRSDWGGGVRCEDSGAVFRNCTLSNNTATSGGAGASVLRGGPSFLNCVFSDNTAPDTGALYFDSCWSGRVESSLFIRNKATSVNGAITVYRGDSAVVACTIADNTGDAALVVWDCVGRTIDNIIAYNTHGYRTNAADPVFRNNWVGMNQTWDYYPSNWDFTGLDNNVTGDPMFVNRTVADYHLSPVSLCIDWGDSSAVTPNVPDLDGFARVDHGAMDLGCYEAALSVTPVRYVFTASPAAAVAGTPFPVQPAVAAVDANGRVAAAYSGTVTLSIKTGTGAADAVLTGTKSLNFVGGRAYFTDLAIDKSGRGYVLRATGALTSAETPAFDVSASPPRLVFTTQPAGATKGVPFQQQPVVAVRDDSGTLTSYTGPVVLSIKSGTGTSGALLNGTRTVNAVAGVATFTGLSIDTLGTNYVLTATTDALPAQDSAAFNVTPPGEKLVFSVQPGGAVSGKSFIMQPVVRVTSRDGILASDYTGTVTLAIKAGTGTSGAILSGTKTVNVVNGVALFQNLSIDKTGLRYILTATSSTLSVDSDPMRVVATTPDLLTRTWTADADFDEGRYSLTAHTPTSGQINLVAYETKPYIWVPNLAGSVSKVDVLTGREVARYRTGPYYTYPNPSRTTVDLRGNCYVANRRIGTLVKIGSEETGDWIDRNGNGVCDTSRDLNGDGDITGAEELPWNQDECVLFEVSLIPGKEGTYQPGQFTQYTNDDQNPGIRSLAIDASNNLWAAGYNAGNAAARKFYYVDGATGLIRSVVDYSSTGHTAYGAVTDSHGVIWSSGQGYNNVLRFDPTTNPPSYRRIDLPHNPYGVGVDGLDHVFVSGWESSKISRLNAITGAIEKTIDAPWRLRGVVCSADNDVWTVSTSEGKIYRYDNDLTTQKAAIPVGDQPTGCAVDKYGKIWACNLGGTDATIVRIDPATNTVELTKPLKNSQGHYSYSDMTGGVSTSITARRGTWTVDFDGGDLNRPWGKVSWTNSLPAGTEVTVRVSSSNDKTTWTAWETAVNGADLASTISGRYLQVEVTLSTQTVGTTPIVLDVTAQAKARPVYSLADAVNALKIAGGLAAASSDDFTKLNVTSSGLPERVALDDATRILRIIAAGQ